MSKGISQQQLKILALIRKNGRISVRDAMLACGYSSMAKARRALDNLEARNEIKMRGFGITEDIDDKTLVWYTSPL